MRWSRPLMVLIWLAHGSFAGQPYCNQTLGLESGQIDNAALSASSSYDDHSTGPHNARLNHDQLGGAWCPKNTIQKGIKEWIQIDLERPHIITGIVTQGRYGRGSGQEYLKYFMVEYRQRPSFHAQWTLYTDKNSRQVFNGSRDTSTPVYQSFNPPISASQIRVIPFSEHPRVVCLRLELHGCPDSSGMTAYSSPVPDLLGTSNVSSDQVYWEEQSHGLLTDGSYGLQDIHINSILTYEDGWMSWKRKGQGKPVELIFKFDSPRKFHKVNIYTANLLHMNIQVFQRAVVWFSIGGEYYIQEPVSYVYMADTILKEPRNVSIRLNDRVAQYVKVELFFSNVWISISEVHFDSEPAEGAFPTEKAPSQLITDKADKARVDKTNEAESSTQEAAKTQEMGIEGSQAVEVEVLIGVLTAVTLILFFLFLVILAYSKRQKFLQSPASRALNPFPAVQINMKELLSASPMLSGETSQGNPLTMEYEHPPVFEDCRSKWHSTGHMDFTSSQQVVRSSVPQQAHITSNPLCSEYASVDIQNIASHHYRTLQASTVNPTAVVQTNEPSSTYNLGHYFPRVSSEPPSRKSYQTASRNGDPLKPLPMAETLWNFTTTVQSLCKQQTQPHPLAEIPRSKLRPKESFGRGCLGEVLLCEVDSDYSNLAQPVAVRSGPNQLHDSIDRQEFLRESRLLSTLRHVNVARLVGVAMSEEPYCTILEHSLHGDLYHYMRQISKIEKSVGGSTTSSSSGCSSASPMMSNNCNGITYNRIIEMAAQIGSGMKYLEERNVVHKDLAARNCLLCDNNVVKITDVAMGISLFNSDYSEVRGRSCAPIRWQPWETLLLGRLSTKSNVWSFGITVWELLTLCRQRPFALLTDIEVLQNAEHAYYSEGLQVELSQPEHCQRDIWELLEECWNRDENNRPTFSEISMFLKRKSLVVNVDSTAK